ncbi:MAG: phosphoadenosine phosphosulfate reductase family protein, partial [Proteobacteria bacterium]|nr:phosphoadenosine phosphosulfate reductase family protein [Pseudomonadota bacterium]
PDPPQTLLQPWTSCCAKLRFEPLLEYLGRSRATLFIHGQRHSDGGGFTVDSGPDAKVEICKLIWEWSDEDILDYIGKHGIELPEQYADGVVDSLECWNCTARAGDSAAGVKARLAYMAKRYPDLFEALKLRMGKVYLATKATFDEVRADTNYVWLKAAEEAEKHQSVQGAGTGGCTRTRRNRA